MHRLSSSHRRKRRVVSGILGSSLSGFPSLGVFSDLYSSLTPAPAPRAPGEMLNLRRHAGCNMSQSATSEARFCRPLIFRSQYNYLSLFVE